MIKKEILGGRLLGFMVEEKWRCIEYIAFCVLDDTIISCGGYMEPVSFLRCMLLCFGVVMVL